MEENRLGGMTKIDSYWNSFSWNRDTVMCQNW